MRITSVRTRLALWNVGVLFTVLAVSGGALRHTYKSKLMGRVDQDLGHRGRHALRDWAGMGPGPGFPPFPFPPGAGPRGPGERGPGDRGPGERGPGDRGPGDRGSADPRPNPWDPGDRRPGGRGPGPWGGPGGPPPPMGTFRPRFLDPPGRSPSSPTAEGPWDRAAFTLAARGEQVYSITQALGQPVRVLSVPLLRDGQVAKVVQFAFPLTDVYEELGRLTRTLLTIVPLALLVAALGGAFLTDRALRPVRRVTQAASQIEASDLSERLPVKGQDEFSVLAATFNAMLGRLEHSFTQREQALDQLAQTLEQQRRFTADASHELRTPLTIIKANTSLALEEERSNVEYRRALEAADRAADATTRIVQDMLLLARGDAGQLEAYRCPTPIGEVLDGAAVAFHGPQSAPIVVEFSDPTLMVSADPHHLVRLFTNLFENAVRHTPLTGRITVSARPSAGGPSAREGFHPLPCQGTWFHPLPSQGTWSLPCFGAEGGGEGSTSTERFGASGGGLGATAPGAVPRGGGVEVVIGGVGEDTVIIRVRDTGEGIPPEHLPHVCERFYRVDSARTRRRGGSGLGLAICRSIVEAHHGSLAIESVVGEGTTVTVRLPRSLSPLPDEAETITGASRYPIPVDPQSETLAGR